MTHYYEKITDGFGKVFLAREVPLHARYRSPQPDTPPPPPRVRKLTPKPRRYVSSKKSRPDVQLAKCPLCNRRFGFVATPQDAKSELNLSAFISKICDRHPEGTGSL